LKSSVLVCFNRRLIVLRQDINKHVYDASECRYGKGTKRVGPDPMIRHLFSQVLADELYWNANVSRLLLFHWCKSSILTLKHEPLLPFLYIHKCHRWPFEDLTA